MVARFQLVLRDISRAHYILVIVFAKILFILDENAVRFAACEKERKMALRGGRANDDNAFT